MIHPKTDGAWSKVERALRQYISTRVESASLVEQILCEASVRIRRDIVRERDGERLCGWVHRTTDAVMVDFVRVRVGNLELQATDSSHEETLQLALSEQVALLIADLPSPYREAIALTELYGRTHPEAADTLKLPLAQFRLRARRGREKIREALDECYRVQCERSGRAIESTEKMRDGRNPPVAGRFRRTAEYL